MPMSSRAPSRDSARPGSGRTEARSTGCDATTHICVRDIGHGIFETTYMGLGMMVKDEKRFPDASGHWGYFSFGHRPWPYENTSPLRPTTQCQGCHVALASESDYVIIRAHIGLPPQHP
jgi:hypothetical protein